MKHLLAVISALLLFLAPGLDARQATMTLGILPITDAKGKALKDDAVAAELSAAFASYRFIR